MQVFSGHKNSTTEITGARCASSTEGTEEDQQEPRRIETLVLSYE